jgi:N-acetylglucosaminyldiphosphoundecaprenol N-acetyl-beta-D-mannosaminyltransferase
MTTSTVESDRPVLFGFAFDSVTMDEVVERCETALASNQRTLIGVANAAKIVNTHRDETLRRSLLECDLLLADGQSVVWASRFLGRPLPERVTGIDLFERLLECGANEGRSVYLLGATAEILGRVQRRLAVEFPNLTVAGSHDGYFAEDEAPEIARDIRRSGAQMLFIGISSPKKELFLSTYADSLGVSILHGVGGSFDIFAGLTKRAPANWQRIGCEWAYRLLQEPGRLGRRYLTTNGAFVWLTVRERIRPTARYAPSVLRDDVLVVRSGAASPSDLAASLDRTPAGSTV